MYSGSLKKKKKCWLGPSKLILQPIGHNWLIQCEKLVYRDLPILSTS